MSETTTTTKIPYKPIKNGIVNVKSSKDVSLLYWYSKLSFLASLSVFTNNTEVRLSLADMHRTPTLKTLQQLSRQAQPPQAATAVKQVLNSRKQVRLYTIRQSKYIQ